MSVPKNPMPIKIEPYAHQRAAFAFACKLFGLDENTAENDSAMRVERNGTPVKEDPAKKE